MKAVTTHLDWSQLANRVRAGHQVTKDEALAMLQTSDADLLPLLSGAYKLRHDAFQNRVHLYVLMNAQSGLCAEDCGYCSQSKVSTAPIDKYPLLPANAIVDGAKRAAAVGASTYCIVTSGTGPSDKQVDQVCEITQKIKQDHGLHVCVCMGLLKDGQAERLKAAGVDRYNHNLNTSESHTPNIVSTHTYEDRVATVERVKAAGMSPCSGAIFGMGESDKDRVDVAFALRDIGSDSIPVNFLHAIPGTPLDKVAKLGPVQCLKILAMMRFVNPNTEIRIAGGREVQLGAMQPLGLYAANSIFVNGYLTTPGQGETRDHQMIRDAGFVVDPKPIRGG